MQMQIIRERFILEFIADANARLFRPLTQIFCFCTSRLLLMVRPFSHLRELSRFLFMSMSVLLCLSQSSGRRGIDGGAVVDRVVAGRDDAVGDADDDNAALLVLERPQNTCTALSMLSMTVIHLHLSRGHAQRAAYQSRRQRERRRDKEAEDGMDTEQSHSHEDDKEGEQAYGELETILNNYNNYAALQSLAKLVGKIGRSLS
jgi:hypothetical protein